MDNAHQSAFSPEDFWERRYREGDIPWEKGAAAPPLLDYLDEHSVRGQVGVPGCGLGHDVRALAGQGAEVLGFDIAPSALEQANAFAKSNGEKYLQIDFLNLPVELEGQFDWIFEHTCFCAIAPEHRENYVRACLRALKPEGHLLAIFYLFLEKEEGPPFPVTEKEIKHLFGSQFHLIEERAPRSCYPGREGRELLCVLRKRVRIFTGLPNG